MTEQRRESLITTRFALPIFTVGVMGAAIIFAWHAPSFYQSSARGFFYFALESLRSAIITSLSELIRTAPERALIYGLLLGGTQQFTSYWKQIFITTGTSHIVAVSGANIAYVVQMCEWALARMPLSFVTRSIILCLTVSFYTLLVGAPSSAVRAALMSVCALSAALIGRQSAPLHALATSILIMVLWDPSVIFNVGFQLSCAATLGLIVTGSPNERISLTRAAEQTIAATAFTLPIIIYHFGVVSFVSLMTNALIVPMVPALTIASAIMLVLNVFSSSIGTLFAAPLVFVAHLILVALEKISRLYGSSALVPISPPFLIMWCAGLLFFVVRYVRRCCVAS